MRTDIDLVILVALAEEFEQFFVQFLGEGEVLRDRDYGSYYYRFRFSVENSKPLDAMASFIGGMGPDRAGRQTERLLEKWSPRMIVLVGICGAIHHDVSLCDVVVPNRVDAYLATTKAIPLSDNNFDFEHRGTEYHCDHELVEQVRHLKFAHRAPYARWQEECSLRASTILAGRVDELARRGILAHRPRIHSGPLASGPVVSAASSFRQWLRKRNSDCTAIEMEAAGIAASASERVSNARFITVRGVSDLADERKATHDAVRSGSIRTLAMCNALGLLQTLARLGSFSPQVNSTEPISRLSVGQASTAGTGPNDQIRSILTTWMLTPLKQEGSVKGVRILLVEDDNDMLNAVADLLSCRGAIPCMARNGHEALLLLERSDQEFDLVISDIVMPIMGGGELARHISSKWPNLPLIFTSGYADGRSIEACVTFLQKPFRLDKLVSAIIEIHNDELRHAILDTLPELRNNFYLLYMCKHNIDAFMRDFGGKGLFETAFRHKVKECIASFAYNIVQGYSPQLAIGRLSHEISKLSMLLRYSKRGQSPSLSDFVRALIRDIQRQHSGIQFLIDLEPEILGPRLESDATIFICIALIELIDNAIEALSKKGNIRIKFHNLEIHQSILMQVWSATGPLSEELCLRIYEEGYSTKGPERGMGLSIIRKFAEYFGGRVELFQDDGVEFSITLPYSQ